MCVAIGLIWVAAGCSSSKWPTPVVFHDQRIDPCARVPQDQRTNKVDLLYATSRQASGNPLKPSYSNDVSKDLTLGTATVQLGDEDLTFDRLCAISTGKEKVNGMPIKVTQMSEVGKLGDGAQER